MLIFHLVSAYALKMSCSCCQISNNACLSFQTAGSSFESRKSNAWAVQDNRSATQPPLPKSPRVWTDEEQQCFFPVRMLKQGSSREGLQKKLPGSGRTGGRAAGGRIRCLLQIQDPASYGHLASLKSILFAHKSGSSTSWGLVLQGCDGQNHTELQFRAQIHLFPIPTELSSCLM